jgi:alkylation response protein AidB-like acyl-CoA dehydrogenase
MAKPSASSPGGRSAHAIATRVLRNASRMAEFVTREVMQMHDVMGQCEEPDDGRYFVDARFLVIFECVEEVSSLRVAGKALAAAA